MAALFLVAMGAAAFAAVALAIPRLMPLFARYAMARPNARSSHRVPTPQGGGMPIVAAVVGFSGLVGLAGAFDTVPLETARFYTLGLLASAALALLGTADDIKPMPALTRFVLQTVLAAIVIFAAPEGWRIFDFLPVAVERALAVVGVVWMVNLTNFMDGIDGIVVAEGMPITAALALFAIFGALSLKAGAIATLLLGGLAGFYLYNRHPARVFLGDVGSLAIGFLLAIMLFELAATRSAAAALLLPLYFITDATLTLLKGLLTGQDVLKAHRRHAYQAAVDGGWRVDAVNGHVIGLNLLLMVLAITALVSESIVLDVMAVAAGFAACLVVIRRFRAAPP